MSAVNFSGKTAKPMLDSSSTDELKLFEFQQVMSGGTKLSAGFKGVFNLSVSSIPVKSSSRLEQSGLTMTTRPIGQKIDTYF